MALEEPHATAIRADELHVWQAWLDRSRDEVARLRSILRADELERAARFRFDRDRDRYVVGRGLLRTLLSSYLGIGPAELSFVYGPHGKPLLADSAGPFGTPITDSERVRVLPTTQSVWLVAYLPAGVVAATCATVALGALLSDAPVAEVQGTWVTS